MLWLSMCLAGASEAPTEPDGFATCTPEAGCTVRHAKRDALPPVPALPDDADAVMRQGALLYRVADCVGCHSPPYQEAQHLGGGRVLPTVFGVFYAPNISPHPTDGIGAWTEADFVRAMREGRAPDGHAYWPTFPYMAYTHMSDDDVHALWVYLRAQPPVAGTTPPHELARGYRSPGLLGLWRSLAFRPGPIPYDDAHDAAWNRGAYLARAVAYCDQCHTPRTATGLLRQRHLMAGGSNPAKAEVHPNLTPAPGALGGWTEDDIVEFLSSGVKPQGRVVDPNWMMHEKVRDSSAYLSEADRRAIAVWLKALPPEDHDPFAP